MKISFHRFIQRDVSDALKYYEEESGPKLADQFFAEFMHSVMLLEENPQRCHLDRYGLRRATLQRFPYHFLYRVRTGDVFILVLRHNKRHPNYGVFRRVPGDS